MDFIGSEIDFSLQSCKNYLINLSLNVLAGMFWKDTVFFSFPSAILAYKKQKNMEEKLQKAMYFQNIFGICTQ